MILAFDTATPATTVALVDGGKVLAEMVDIDARRHAETLGPAIASVLKMSGYAPGQIRQIVVGVGPGAYTGLRVGVASANAFGHALGVPVHGVVTLDVLAYESDLHIPFAVVSDARRKELFWARYSDAATRTAGPAVGYPEVVARQVGDLPVVGAAATPFADAFEDRRSPGLPSAGALGQLAELWLAKGRGLLPATPLYLRQPDVAPASAPKSVLS